MIYPTSIQLPNEHPGFASLSSCLLRLLPSTPHPHHLLKLMITNPLSSFPHLHRHVSMPQKETPPSPCAHPCHRRRPNTTPNSVAFLRLVSLSLISSRSGTPPTPPSRCSHQIKTDIRRRHRRRLKRKQKRKSHVPCQCVCVVCAKTTKFRRRRRPWCPKVFPPSMSPPTQQKEKEEKRKNDMFTVASLPSIQNK